MEHMRAGLLQHDISCYACLKAYKVKASRKCFKLHRLQLLTSCSS